MALTASQPVLGFVIQNTPNISIEKASLYISWIMSHIRR